MSLVLYDVTTLYIEAENEDDLRKVGTSKERNRHALADMVVVADVGMLSASNLRELDNAHLRFIVGSRATKAPNYRGALRLRC